MVLTLFRSNRPVILIFILFFAATPWVIDVFAAPVLVQENVPVTQIYQFLEQGLSSWSPLSKILAFLLTITQAFYLTAINKKFIFIEGRTYFPLIVFLFFTASLPEMRVFNPALLANFFVLLAFSKLFDTYRKEVCHRLFFDAGFLLSLSVLIFTKSAICLPVLWFCMIILRPFNIREWLISLLGFLTPQLLILSWYFIKDSTAVWLDYLSSELINKSIFFSLPIYYYIVIGYFLLLILTGIGYFYFRYRSKKISVHKYFTALIWMFLLTSCVIFLPASDIHSLILLSLPASFIIANFFVLTRTKWLGDILLLLLILFLYVFDFSYLLLYR